MDNFFNALFAVFATWFCYHGVENLTIAAWMQTFLLFTAVFTLFDISSKQTKSQKARGITPAGFRAIFRTGHSRNRW